MTGVIKVVLVLWTVNDSILVAPLVSTQGKKGIIATVYNVNMSILLYVNKKNNI